MAYHKAVKQHLFGVRKFLKTTQKKVDVVKLNLIMVISLLAVISCQNPPTKTDAENGGPEHGFLPPPVLNASMQNLKQDMIGLQHYIFDKKQFEKPENKAFLQKEIHKLAVESKNVKHDPALMSKDPTIQFVASQFAEEVQRAEENFKAGWTEHSRWQLVKVTSYCLECHTRMRDGVSFKQESTRSYLTTLPVPAQIEFMVAFRQFEPGFNLALEKLKEPQAEARVNTDSDRIARLGLLIAVQYMQDPEKAKKITSAIERNSTLPLYLKSSGQLWKKSLQNWDANEVLNVLPQVRNLVDSRISEVEDMRAIPALLKMITDGLNRDELGEALYLTGQSYESLNKISFMSLHENYYEMCVRKSSHTAWGPRCYQKLSDAVTVGYSGSSGTHIPKDVQRRLDELKKEIKVKK